jgi:hypothetical protein
VADGELAEIVYHAVVRAVLFVDLEDAPVLGVAGREDARLLAGQEDAGVGAMAVGEAADDEHAVDDAQKVARRERGAVRANAERINSRRS